MASPGQGGDLLDRCTLEVRDQEGQSLGTGVLVGPRRVLTCSHVVGEHERLDLFAGPSSERVAGATVVRCGDPAGADDLALLELDTSISNRGVIRFADWTRGERFGTVGFPEWGKDHVGGHVHGLSEHRGWVQIDAEGSRLIESGFSGGAVWVEAKHAAVGIVTHRDPNDGVAYAITAEKIRGFWPRLRDGEVATRCARYLSRVGGKLEAPKVRSAITDADPAGAWKKTAQYPDLLAEELCLETEPEDLAGRLSAAYCRLAEDRRPETAEQVWEVLMEALPAALLSRWQIEVPEAADPEVRLQVVGRVLAELALAAAEDAAADFHEQPDREDSDIPRATHRVPRPGEQGADPDGKEAASELAEEVGLRLALDAGLPKDSPVDRGFLGVLASRRHTGRDARLFDHSELGDYRGAPPGTLLRMLNDRLAQPSDSGGRRLYFVAGPGDRALVSALRQHLPGLKVVMLDPPPDQFEITGKVLHALKKVFVRRRDSMRPKP